MATGFWQNGPSGTFWNPGGDPMLPAMVQPGVFQGGTPSINNRPIQNVGAGAAAMKNAKSLKDLFGWSKGSGLTAFGKNIGSGVPLMYGITEGIQGATNLSNLGKTQGDINSLKDSILQNAAGNPLINSYLTSDQLNLLRRVKTGRLKNTGGEGILGGIGEGLGSTLMNTLMAGAIGGIPGAAVAGIGGLVNSGIKGYEQGVQRQAPELEALYQALADAQAQTRAMRAPNFAGMGIQQQYQNMYR